MRRLIVLPLILLAGCGADTLVGGPSDEYKLIEAACDKATADAYAEVEELAENASIYKMELAYNIAGECITP